MSNTRQYEVQLVTTFLTSDTNRRVIQQKCNDDSEYLTCCLLFQGGLLGHQVPLNVSKHWLDYMGWQEKTVFDWHGLPVGTAWSLQLSNLWHQGEVQYKGIRHWVSYYRNVFLYWRWRHRFSIRYATVYQTIRHPKVISHVKFWMLEARTPTLQACHRIWQ